MAACPPVRVSDHGVESFPCEVLRGSGILAGWPESGGASGVYRARGGRMGWRDPKRHKRLVSVCRRRRMVSARVCRNAQCLAYRDVFLWRSGADRGGGDGDERRRAGAAARHSHHNLAGCRLLSFANGHHLRHYAMEHRFGNEQPLCPSVGSDRVARRGPCHERGVAHCRLIGGQYRRLCDFSVAVHHG